MNGPYIANSHSRRRSSCPVAAITTSRVRPTSSFATVLRRTPALKGLRNTAQGCRALASAPLGNAPPNREANPPLRRTQRSLAAFAKRSATHLPRRSLRKLTPFFATPLRRTPAPKGLRNTAQGCRASASAPLGNAPNNREANPPLRRTHRSPAASAKRPATHLPAC